MCGEGGRHGREAALEQEGFTCEGIENGRGVPEVAIGTEAIGAKGVDSDEDDVRRRDALSQLAATLHHQHSAHKNQLSLAGTSTADA